MAPNPIADWSRAYDAAALTLGHRINSARARLDFMGIQHSQAEVARCAYRTIRAMEVFGRALDAYAPEAEIPWALCWRWQLLKLRTVCSQWIRDLIAPSAKMFKRFGRS